MLHKCKKLENVLPLNPLSILRIFEKCFSPNKWGGREITGEKK